MERGRSSDLEDVNVELMANELDRLLEKHKGVLDWNDRLNAAGILLKHYGSKLKAMDYVFSNIVPKYEELRRDREIIALAHRFIDFGDRYNKGEMGGVPIDLRSFPEPNLNEVRAMVREVVRGMIG